MFSACARGGRDGRAQCNVRKEEVSCDLYLINKSTNIVFLSLKQSNCSTVTYGDSDGAAPQSIRVTESMEDTSESDDEETADEVGYLTASDCCKSLSALLISFVKLQH